MKNVITSILTASALATSAIAQVVTPVWVEHLNGQQGMSAADRLPILVKNLGAYENNNGQSAQISLGKLLPYDSTRFLLYVRENGIDESQPHDANVSNAFPDRSLIWINAATGAPFIPAGHSNAVAITWGAIPIAITGQGSQYDFFSEWGLDEDKNIYLGHKNKIIRFAKLPGQDAWSSTPTCAWTEPTPGATDCNGVALDGSTSGDGNQSMRFREFRVTGKGTSTTIFAGGGTWRQGSNPQMLVTTNGFDFAPVSRLDSRDNGAAKNSYALGGQSSSVVRYGWDSTRPNLETVYTGHFPGTGYGARPNRYETDPDNPEVTLPNFSYSGIPLTADDIANGYTWGKVRVLHREEIAAGESQPAFAWEAAGTHGTPETVLIDGDKYYDGNWSCAIDANASLDYIVNYSMPSWNNQYPVISGTNYHKPGWIGVHRLDGSIAPNSAWKLPCTEDDIANSDNGGVGNDFGYTGDVTVIPDKTAPANLKKATIFWSGGAYGFGLFTVQNVPAAVTLAPPSSVTVVEGQTLTINSTFTGSPNSFAWALAGNPLDTTQANSDGSLHFPLTVVQGPNKANLQIAGAVVADSGHYTLTLVNPLSGTNVYNVNVTVLPDTNKPTVMSVTALGTLTLSSTTTNPSLVKVVFNKRVDSGSAGTVANYHINGVTITGATTQTDTRVSTLGGDWREVILQTSGLTPGNKYTLTVSGVIDQAATPNTITTVNIPFQAPIVQSGGLSWDYYYVGSGSLGALYGSSIYPNAPMTNLTFSSFDTSPFTGGDLNNNLAFGSAGDNYGDSLSGWITPATSGDYYFFLASDDASDLYLSTDATPGNAITIAQEPNCCHGFLEPDASVPQTSGLINLVAGKRYYIQAVHAEGGGGDYVKVAWRSASSTNSASTLTPISGSVLSSYATVPGPTFGRVTLSGSTVTIPWTSYNPATVQVSTDLKNWSSVPGNPNPIIVNATLAPKKFYRLLVQ